MPDIVLDGFAPVVDVLVGSVLVGSVPDAVDGSGSPRGRGDGRGVGFIFADEVAPESTSEPASPAEADITRPPLGGVGTGWAVPEGLAVAIATCSAVP